MVNYTSGQLDAAFSALADPTRRQIVARLMKGSATVSEVAKPFAMSLPAVSRHLKVLEGAGLLVRRRRGRFHDLVLNAQPLKEAAAWLGLYEDFWERQLDALEVFLAQQSKEAAGE